MELTPENTQPSHPPLPSKPSRIRKLFGPIVLLIGIAMPCIIAYECLFNSNSHRSIYEIGKGLLMSYVFIVVGRAWMRGKIENS